ncbi:MAG: EAL domain-containing protein [Acidimicrobiia bacterium]
MSGDLGRPEALGGLAGALPASIERALEASDAMAAVIDPRGVITAHNRSWAEAAEAHGVDAGAVGVGVDYLAVCEAATGADADSALEAARGIRAVLRGDVRRFTMDYECSGPDERRWFALRASPLSGPGSGALITHVDISTLRAAEIAIRSRVDGLWDVVEPGADFVFVVDPTGVVLARTRDESRPEQWPVVGESALDHLHADDRLAAEAALASLLEEPGARTTVAFRARGGGEPDWRHFRATVANMVDDPTVGGIVVGVLDVSDVVRSSAWAALRSAMASELPVAAIATDDSSVVLAANGGAADLLGVPLDELVGRSLRRYIASRSAEDVGGHRAAISEGRAWTGELWVRRRDGVELPLAVWIRRTVDPTTGLGQRLYLAIDHSEQHRLRASLAMSAERDALTGLANRAAFIRHVRQRVDALGPGETAVVAEVSLDRFREVNEVHGAAVGDAVLRAVGAALVEWAGPEAPVARLHGDVFAVLLPGERAGASLGDELLLVTEVVEARQDLSLRLSASVGIRSVTADDGDAALVMDEALTAVREAKAAGGGQSRTFDARLRAELGERARLRAELARAVVAGELVVEYQPIVRMADGSVVGAEALVRWDHPTEGLLPPDRFIPLAEQTFLVHEIGAIVLEDACASAARWRDLRPEEPVSVAVNLSPAQLGDDRLADRVASVLGRHALDPATLTLELTESMAMDPSGVAGRQMARLRALGVRIAIDDFGTGYSSLGRLKALPLDEVKIDRSFVSGVTADPEDLSIVRTIVSLAEAVGVAVVVEGVERRAEAEALLAVGCTVGQGFLWSRPVPADVLDDLLRQPVGPPLSPVGVDDPPVEGGSADALRLLVHELAGPLAALNLSLASRDEPGVLPEPAVEAIERTVERVAHLVSHLDLLDRVDRGTLRPNRSDVDVSAMVQRVAGDLGGGDRRAVSVDADGALVAPVDAHLVELAVTNLVANALKYSPRDTPIDVGVRADGDGFAVEVHDRGPGIPAAQVGTAWRKFGRVHHGAPGAGIGLYLARGIARAHGGDVRYRARPGGGSTFVLQLPIGGVTA